MTGLLNSRATGALFIAFLLACAACGRTAPSTFYTLNPVLEPVEGKKARMGKGCTVVVIGPVDLPPYLDRPQIVSVVDRNEVAVGEFEKWAEPLKDHFPYVLAENLSSMLSKQPFIVLPSRGSTPVDYRVGVDVIRMDGTIGSYALLVARWTLFEEKRKQMMFVKRSVYKEPTEGKDYKAFVAAHSRLVGALSREIADALQELPSK